MSSTPKSPSTIDLQPRQLQPLRATYLSCPTYQSDPRLEDVLIASKASPAAPQKAVSQKSSLFIRKKMKHKNNGRINRKQIDSLR